MKPVPINTSAPREWLKLSYNDPAHMLVGLRNLAIKLSGSAIREDVRNLRTNELKKFREGRQAALFCYGLSQRIGRPVRFALQEQENDATDAIGLLDIGGEAMLLPIQLKELPPAHLNPRIGLQDILTKLGSKSSGARDTIVAVHINRAVRVVVSELTIPTGIAELWLFGAIDETQDRWFLIGDLLRHPGLTTEFTHPGRRLLLQEAWTHVPARGRYAVR